MSCMAIDTHEGNTLEDDRSIIVRTNGEHKETNSKIPEDNHETPSVQEQDKQPKDKQVRERNILLMVHIPRLRNALLTLGTVTRVSSRTPL